MQQSHLRQPAEKQPSAQQSLQQTAGAAPAATAGEVITIEAAGRPEGAATAALPEPSKLAAFE